MANKNNLKQAEQLMTNFVERTGIRGTKGHPGRRYLWTDAFAVKCFFGLSRALNDEDYRQLAIELIDLVHYHLGRYHPQDERQGWISGLSEEEGRLRSTAAGLRIGKKLPERQQDQSYNSRLEWERDGQYFHYLSRWMSALLQAHKEVRDEKYLLHARDLFLATDKFIYGSGAGLAMYWKMDTELSRPLVPNMGAHDPLEGMLLGLSLKNALFEKDEEVEALIEKFEIMCRGKSWTTTDPLGVGGLLLDAVRAEELEHSGINLPPSIEANKLFEESAESLAGLPDFKEKDPNRRLAFRECGLSLGLRITEPSKNAIINTSSTKLPEKKFYLASKIEEFWLDHEHQQAASWVEHLDINAISLAASLIAQEAPEAFSAA